MDERTLAYVAAVVDLLGLIRIRDAGGTQLPVVQLHGKYLPTMQYLGELTGTRAIQTRRSYARAGCSEHCADKHQHIVSVSGRWSLTGAKATILLWNIRPFLRLQVERAAQAMNVGFSTPFKPATLQKMQQLGWDVPEFSGFSGPLKN